MKFATFAGAVLAATTIAGAQPTHSGDIILRLESGRITTGRVENSIVVYGRRVFSATFGDTGIPNATFNPGVDSEVGAFPPGQFIGVTIRRALRVWDGEEFVVIPQPPTPPARLNIVKNSIAITTPVDDPEDCGVAGNLILGVVNGTGKIHEHPAYQLLDPADGVYLLELEVWMSDPASAVSAPVFVVFSQNSGVAFPAALAWAEEHLGACYANCDGSTLPPRLNANDFLCFMNSFAAGACAANCDESSSPPVLTANDFLCFINRFAAGCC